MSIVIHESGLSFGEYDESHLFHVEKSLIYRSLGDGISTIEFVLYKEKGEILLIEAKSSSPKPLNREDFDGFINEVSIKFAHSIDLFFSIINKRIADNDKEVSDRFIAADYANIKIMLLLVINGHRVGWLAPISEALTKKLRMQIKTWRLELAVINHELAAEYGLLKL